MENSRRDYIKKNLTGTATIDIGGILPEFSAKSYNRITGSNEKIRVSMMGIYSLEGALTQTLAEQTICDVDSRTIDKCRKCLKE